ncbi:hypothetical protein WJX82_004762 [Trebouxia sp. C0006]
MARPKLRLDLSTAEDKENQSVVKDLKRRSSTDVVAVRELQAFQTQVAKLWTTKEQDDTSSRGSLSSLVDLSNKPPSAVPGSSLDTAVSVGTPDLTERGICFDFLRGQCHRGLLCRFSHDLSSLAAQQCQRGSRRNAPICYDFVKGVCARGPDCRYSHDINSIINDTRHSSQNTHAGQLCHDYSKGRCARGAACRYSHDFSALTAASPLMPALTAAAAAAAIAQISMNPGGLLPQIAPYLQSYMPPAPQHTSLQQHMLHERMHSAPVLSHPFPFANTNFVQAGVPRDVGAGQVNSFGVPSPHNSFGAPYAGLTAHSGWQAGSQMSHSSSLLSQRLQAQQASKHMYAPLQDQSRERNPPLLAAQKSLPELYGVPGGMATVPVGGRSYDSAQTGFVNMASRNAGVTAAAVQRPPYSPFEALQSLSRESPPVSKPEIMTSSLADRQPSLGSPIMASGTDAMQVEAECNSSTSDSSSVLALEASDSGLASAGSGHLFMCQEIWKR